MKLVKHFSLIAIILCCAVGFAGNKCVELLASRQTKHGAQLDNYLATEVEIERAFLKTDPAFSKWASNILAGQFDFYRGMVLSEADLKNILEVGFDVARTGYEGVYVDHLPERALDFITVRFKQAPKLGVIFVLDLSVVNLEHKFGTTWISKTNIPPTAIKQIWLFDKKANAEFPSLPLKPVLNSHDSIN